MDRQKFNLRTVQQKATLVAAAAMLAFSSCGGGKDEEADEMNDGSDTVKTTVLNVKGQLFSIPSPIQTALLIQKSGITYDKSVLSAPNKVNQYATSLQQALNLGVYGADLGYVSLYNQTQDALGYLSSIKQLSDKLGLSAAFDAPTMERIKNNITNKDSMTVLVGLAYRASNAYLKDNSREDLSSYILLGGWLESMHFSVAAYKSKPSDQIRYRIAEQKLSLNSLLKILGAGNAPEIAPLSEKLTAMSKIYDEITFKYTFVEPTTDTTKKVTNINSTTEVTISDAQMQQIAEKLSEIRAMIVNPS